MFYSHNKNYINVASITLLGVLLGFMIFTFDSKVTNNFPLVGNLRVTKPKIEGKALNEETDRIEFTNCSAFTEHTRKYNGRKTMSVKFINGARANVYITQKYPGFWSKLNERLWETSTLEDFASVLRPNDVYIGFGAWIGPLALFAATITENTYVLEPDFAAYEELCANLALNPVLGSKINAVYACIGEKNEISKFHVSKIPGNSVSSLLSTRHTKTGLVVDVPCYTLETFIQVNRLTQLDFLKIDTEGSEMLILPSIASVLHAFSPPPSLHLSTHPPFWPDDKKKIAAEILKILRSVYGSSCFVSGSNFTVMDEHTFPMDFATFFCTTR